MTTTPGHWETIRPWIDRISLQLKELTSVSATFILTSAIAAADEAADEELAGIQMDDRPASTSTYLSHKSVGEVLSRGFTIKVNGALWKNSFLSVEDDDSEAVIVLHGLRPARQYEVELVIEQEEKPLRRDFATPDNETTGQTVDEMREETEDNSEESANASFNAPSSPLSGPSRELTPPVTPDSTSPPHTTTFEDEVAQYKQTMVSISQEHESLMAQLKVARKESQRVENSVRGEIEALKKSGEKQSIPDQRARQKVLALQEAVKQTQSAVTEIEAQTKLIQEQLPRLQKEEAAVEAEHHSVQEVANKKATEVENAIKSDKRRISELQSEVTALSNRIDKLTTKRDKLSNDTVPDLEQQLADMRKEIEAVEAEKEQLSRYTLTEEPLPSPTGYRNPVRQPPMPWHVPRRSGQFLNNQIPQTYSSINPSINAAAPPFYPSRQPGIIHRISGQQASNRPLNEFRPFDTHVNGNQPEPVPYPTNGSAQPGSATHRTTN